MTSPTPLFGSDAFLDAISEAVYDSPGHIVAVKIDKATMQTIAHALRELMLCKGCDHDHAADLPDRAREILVNYASWGGVAYTNLGAVPPPHS